MQQMTFAELEYAHKQRKICREIFLEKLAAVIPLQQLDNVVAKHYTKPAQNRRLITTGSVTASYFTTAKAPIDALIIGSIDET